MHRIKSTGSAIRSSWNDAQQRKTLMWVFVAIGVLIIGYGVYTVVNAQLEYMDRTDEIDKATDRIDAFVQQYPTAEVDGETKPDLRDASQEDVMFLATLERAKLDAQNNRVDADNQRRTGVRIVGVGVIALALAYLVTPDRKPEPEPEADGESSDPPA